MVQVDLHLHTTRSDGRLSPRQLVELAAERGLKVIALTDHDSTEGLAEAMTAAARFPELTLIPGIELSTDVTWVKSPLTLSKISRFRILTENENPGFRFMSAVDSLFQIKQWQGEGCQLQNVELHLLDRQVAGNTA